MNCPLCHHSENTVKHVKKTGEVYRDCSHCQLIFLEESFLPSADKEMSHYMTHNNDVHDKGYQNFVSPIVNYILEHIPNEKHGLDFGAGPGPVITHLLEKQGYEMTLYDPFFRSDEFSLNRKYDFIVACEVIEHFHTPAKDFRTLRSVLKEEGSLAIMTDFYDDSIDFGNWYYHRDPTHVCFYRIETMSWISSNFNFKEVLRIGPRTIILK